MCAGDLTIEGFVRDSGVLVQKVTGWGNTHQCRNWDDIIASISRPSFKIV